MRVWHVLGVGSLAGVASLALLPVETLAPATIPAPALRLLATVQPAILTGVALAVGTALAPKIGLAAPLIESALPGRSPWDIVRSQVPVATLGAIATATVLVVYATFVTPRLSAETGLAAKLSAFEVPLITRVLYGGITEEILARWGLVSLFAWVAWRLGRRHDPPAPGYFILAIGLAALLFAAGHLPLLFVVTQQPPFWLAAAVLVGNVVPGMVFGWLFWRYGIEAAIMAHIGAHLLSWPYT